MVSQNTPTDTDTTDTADIPTPDTTFRHTARLVRFPPALYKTLRKYVLVEREPTISINAFIVMAVKNQLGEEGISLT